MFLSKPTVSILPKMDEGLKQYSVEVAEEEYRFNPT